MRSRSKRADLTCSFVAICHSGLQAGTWLYVTTFHFFLAKVTLLVASVAMTEISENQILNEHQNIASRHYAAAEGGQKPKKNPAHARVHRHQIGWSPSFAWL